MAAREKNPRLQKLFDANKNVYSISKINTIDQCLYQAYRTYKLHDRGKNNVYGIMGGRVHDVLEAIINDEATKEDLLPALNQELKDLEMLGIDFPKIGDSTAIRDNWVSSMTNFCESFIKPKGKFTTEEFIIYQINEDRYVQGYIDLIKHNNDGSISIYDWKTSSDFKKKDLIHHGRQLVFYAMAKEQEGFKVKEVAWIMLKYIEISFMGKKKSNSKNETLIQKVVERCKLAKELCVYVERDLDNLGYDEIDIELMLQKVREDNNLDSLPKTVRDKYTIKPYVRKYEVTDELRRETSEYINSMADLFETLSDEEREWKGLEVDKKNSFFCNVLCSHGDKCSYLKKYLETLDTIKDEDADLF